MYDVQAYLFLSEAFFPFLTRSIDEQIGRGSTQNRLEASSFFSLDEMFSWLADWAGLLSRAVLFDVNMEVKRQLIMAFRYWECNERG